MTASLALSSVLFSVSQTASAAAVHPANGTVRAEINGRSIQAIAVGDTTYVSWGALSAFHTPYEYLGNGEFAVTGGTIQGVVYKGVTYLPWNRLAPHVKATKLKGGGFNFTSIPVPHDYQIVVLGQNGTVGSPDPIEVLVADEEESVPNQKIQISLDGNSSASGYGSQKSFSVTTDANGTWTGGINDTTPETVHLTVTWKTPGGKVVSQETDIAFTASTSTPTVTPSDDTVVATTPLTVSDDALFFNAVSDDGQNIMFQLDTGAYEPLIPKQLADELQLKNLGSDEVEGIGGEDEAYDSEISLSIGGHEFDNIPCLVDASYSGPPLFGYRFFADFGYDLLISQKHDSITILQ